MVERVLHGHVVRRRSRGDAVEVVGIPLRLHQRLAAAVGAAGEVGVRGRATVEPGDHRLGDLGRDVHAAVGEVDLRLRVAGRPRAVVLALVPHVGRGAGDGAVGDRRAARGLAVIDVGAPAEAAAAGLDVALGPAVDGQAHDDRVGRRDRAAHGAIGRGRPRRLDRRRRDGDRGVGDAVEVEPGDVRTVHHGCDGRQIGETRRCGRRPLRGARASGWGKGDRNGGGGRQSGCGAGPTHESLSGVGNFRRFRLRAA